MEKQVNFNSELVAKADQINKLMENVLDVDTGYAQYLMEAMQYSVNGGGKRLRPMLMEEISKKFSRNCEAELKYFMAALELIHSYSLVHDDMPCIDNDEYRRGRKTTHAVYGETTALLAGDGLLNYAYETAVKAFDVTDNPAIVGKALKVLTKKAGIFGMVGGQAADVETEKNGALLSKDRLLYIHEKKTGALIESAMMIGGILAGADDKEIELLEQAGSAIGIAFQIRDDILDVEGTFEELGKPIGSDADNSKETYVTLFGMERAKKDVEDYSMKALSIIESLGKTNDFLVELVKSLVLRTK